MATTVEIANKALNLIGHEGTISSLEQSSLAAVTVNRFYDDKRKEMLRLHEWGFATETRALREVTAAYWLGRVHDLADGEVEDTATGEAIPFGTAYAAATASAAISHPIYSQIYEHPTNMIRLLSVMVEGGRNKDVKIDYEIESDTSVRGVVTPASVTVQNPVVTVYHSFAASGRVIVSDTEEVVVKYIRDVTDEGDWDDLFRICFEYFLAASIAVPLTGSMQTSQIMMRNFQNLMPVTTGVDAAERQDTTDRDAPWVQARQSGGG